MDNLVHKAKTEFGNVHVTVEQGAAVGEYDQKYSAVANGIFVTADTTHTLFERVKNIIGEREVATDNERQG